MDTNFVNQQTVLDAGWTQDVNDVVYRLLGASTGPGGAAPTTRSQITANLGVGAFVSSVVGGVSLPIAGTLTELTNITLTPGDWDIWGNSYISGSVVVNSGLVGIVLAPTTIPSWPTAVELTGLTGNAYVLNVVPAQVTVTVDTVYYLVAQATASSGTLQGSGYLAARRWSL